MQPNSPRAIKEQFNKPGIEKAIKSYLKQHLGYTGEYEKVLVTTVEQNIQGITILQFQDILYQVTKNIDMQNYQDPVLRTLQLIRHVLFEDPDNLALLIKNTKHPTKRKLLKNLLQDSQTQKIVEKKAFENLLIQILQNSQLSQPETLAKKLYKTYKKPSRKKFLKAFIELEIPKEKQEYRSLQSFFDDD